MVKIVFLFSGAAAKATVAYPGKIGFIPNCNWRAEPESPVGKHGCSRDHRA